jgi:hypothetical protein
MLLTHSRHDSAPAGKIHWWRGGLVGSISVYSRVRRYRRRRPKRGGEWLISAPPPGASVATQRVSAPYAENRAGKSLSNPAISAGFSAVVLLC